MFVQNLYGLIILKKKLKFKVSFLKQEDNAPFTLNDLVNLFIDYDLGRWSRDVNTGFTLKD